MSGFRTPNGHNINPWRGEPRQNLIRQSTALRDEERREAQERAKESFENRSPKNKANQEKHWARMKDVEKRYAELEKVLSEEIADLYKKLVESIESVGPEKTFKKFGADLRKIKRKSDKHLALHREKGSTTANAYYDQMMYRLARKFPVIIPYLPSEYFTHMIADPLPLQSVDAQGLEKLEARLLDDGTFANATFKSKYLKFFPEHITEEADVLDIAYAIPLKPECLAKFDKNGRFRAVMRSNPKLMYNMVKREPRVLLYLSKEELYILAQNYPGIIGSSIVKVPDILASENFNNAFFEKFNPKYIFASCSLGKTELEPLISRYFNKIPALDAYCRIKKKKVTVKDNEDPLGV